MTGLELDCQGWRWAPGERPSNRSPQDQAPGTLTIGSRACYTQDVVTSIEQQRGAQRQRSVPTSRDTLETHENLAAKTTHSAPRRTVPPAHREQRQWGVEGSKTRFHASAYPE